MGLAPDSDSGLQVKGTSQWLLPLANVANLTLILGMGEDTLRRILGSLHDAGWVSSVRRGMMERRQHR